VSATRLSGDSLNAPTTFDPRSSMRTGKEIWVRDVNQPQWENEGASPCSPIIVDDLVVMGPAGIEIGSKAWVGAFKLSPKPAGSFNTIPDDCESRVRTAGPIMPHASMAGGTVWGSLTYDTESG